MTKPLLMLICWKAVLTTTGTAICRLANYLDAKSRIIVAERSAEDQANVLS